jgi:hypothetical protein
LTATASAVGFSPSMVRTRASVTIRSAKVMKAPLSGG